MTLKNTVSACRILRVSRATIYRRMQARLLQYVVKDGHRMVMLDSLPRAAR